jgi:hypothetical protein
MSGKPGVNVRLWVGIGCVVLFWVVIIALVILASRG